MVEGGSPSLPREDPTDRRNRPVGTLSGLAPTLDHDTVTRTQTN